MNSFERTLSIIKPDAVERKLENEIKNCFINSGFVIEKEKKIQLSKEEAEDFYKVHQTKPLLIKQFLTSFSSFLSTASGLIIDSVCSKLLIVIFYKLI